MSIKSTIQNKMKEIAKTYTETVDQNTYLDAAARFRLPYWDMIMPRQDPTDENDATTMWACPRILKQKYVYVKYPQTPNEFTELLNPLASFTFPDPDDYTKPKRKPLNQRSAFNPQRTVRNPSLGSKGETDWDKLDTSIQRQARATAITFWQCLHPDAKLADIKGQTEININQQRPWDAFAHHSYGTLLEDRKGNEFRARQIDGRLYPVVSLESFHDSIHGIVGGGEWDSTNKKWTYQGQMGDPAYAAVSYNNCIIR